MLRLQATKGIPDVGRWTALQNLLRAWMHWLEGWLTTNRGLPE